MGRPMLQHAPAGFPFDDQGGSQSWQGMGLLQGPWGVGADVRTRSIPRSCLVPDTDLGRKRRLEGTDNRS
jgi:hypothetical protein